MKKILNLMGIFGSICVAALLFLLELALGVNLAAKEFLSTETFSKSVQKMDFQTILVDENNKETKTGAKFYNYFKLLGINKEQINNILKNDEFKVILGNYLGSIMLKKIDEKTEVVYPTKNELVEFVQENYELLENSLGLKENDQKKIEELIDKKYSQIKKDLERLAKEIGEL